MTFDSSCIFCKIAQKQAPSSIIYENESVLIFLDIKPLNLGHTLIIPKAHYVDIFDIPEEWLSQIHIAAKLGPSLLKSYRSRWNKHHPAE